jgi:hypothetical protein
MIIDPKGVTAEQLLRFQRNDRPGGRSVQKNRLVAKSQKPGSRSSKPLESPFVIVVDTAEQLPFSFANLHADAAQLHRPLVVRLLRRHIPIASTRLSIDYSIDGFEHQVGIERKSHEDFCNTLAGRHRDRFEKKLIIINESFQHFTVVVEAEWSTILYQPPDFSSVVPKTLFRTVVAWQQRYQRVHWLFLPNRRLAEMATYRVLERWWKDQQITTKVEQANSQTGTAKDCDGDHG